MSFNYNLEGKIVLIWNKEIPLTSNCKITREQ